MLGRLLMGTLRCETTSWETTSWGAQLCWGARVNSGGSIALRLGGSASPEAW